MTRRELPAGTSVPEVNFALAEVLCVLLQDIFVDEGLGTSSTGVSGIFLARQVKMKFLSSCVQHVLQHIDL